jgi:predicted peptidase
MHPFFSRFIFFVLIIFTILPAKGQKVIRKGVGAHTGQKKPPTTEKYDLSVYEKKTWISPTGDTLRYRLLLPENYDTSKRYPLVLFLHGAGERGNDNEKQLTHGAGLFLNPENRKNFPAIVVFPQCDSLSYWSNVIIGINDSTKKREFNFQVNGEPTKAMNLLLQWLPDFEKSYGISASQRYVMGLSMGGMGTFEIVSRKQKYFAAAIPICGGANPKTVSTLTKTAFWIFHGMKDDVVPYQLSETMVLGFQSIYVAEEVNFTLYPEANHNSWDKAFAEPDLLPWLFSIKSKHK